MPRCGSCLDVCLCRGWLWRWWEWGFPPLFAPVCDGEALLALIVHADPGQEVGRDMLGFDPGAGAHFSFPPLIKGHKPLATCPVVPVDY